MTAFFLRVCNVLQINCIASCLKPLPALSQYEVTGPHTFASLSLEPHLSPIANNMPVKVSFSISHSRQTLWERRVEEQMTMNQTGVL